MSLTVCAEPGCPELGPATYCDTHQRAKRKASDRRRPPARARGYDTRWATTRRRYLDTHPICEDASGCLERATDVDHLDGQGPLGPAGHDHDNLRALCHSHHSQRTARDQPGGWNAR